MIVNNTCVLGNGTSTCLASSSPAGLAVGLTLFFLLLVTIAALIVYKYRSEIRNMLQPGHENQKEDYTETPEAHSHQYTGASLQQAIGQTPIYENLTQTTQTTRYNRCTVNQSRLSGEREEDLYLQCDLPDDAIYSNDLACNQSVLADSHEEDVYTVPDS